VAVDCSTKVHMYDNMSRLAIRNA